ncbi:MAG: hypothetical protein U1E53_16765 [Dongiaceae bacterium]
MTLGRQASAAWRVLATPANGPTLHQLCDPLLAGRGGGDAHLRRFYKTALANPVMRLLLRRAGLPQLRDEARLRALTESLRAARDDASPDWAAIGRPLAALLDEMPRAHPRPPAVAATAAAPPQQELDAIIGDCARHLLGTFERRRFIPAAAAFKLVGDPDFHGRDLITALQGLNARTYKNATLLFNLARVFVLGNPQVGALVDRPWQGIAEPLWEPVQIRHRSAYYDAFYSEALMDFMASGVATAAETAAARAAVEDMIRFCIATSRETVPAPRDGRRFDVITALVPPPDVRMSKFFWRIKSELGFGVYVPDWDTTVCSLSAATQFGAEAAILEQPLPDLLADYQVGNGNRGHLPTVTINDVIDYEGGIASWIESIEGAKPFGNDLDPTLNLDVVETILRNLDRWRVLETPSRLDVLRRIISFQRRLVESGAFADPRAHIYYLPELYCAYVGRCWAAFAALPAAQQAAIDPDGAFAVLRRGALGYVRDDLMAHEMNPFDAALALLALAKLEAGPETFAPALAAIVRGAGEGGRHGPFKAYEWNKMKTPTRILVGGPEVTSAFVLSALAHARVARQRAASQRP